MTAHDGTWGRRNAFLNTRSGKTAQSARTTRGKPEAITPGGTLVRKVHRSHFPLVRAHMRRPPLNAARQTIQ